MKLKILFKTEKLPVLYRHRVVSLFKEAIKLADEELFGQLFNGPQPKPYSFSLRLPEEYKVEKLPVQIDEKFTPERFKELQSVETFIPQKDKLFSLIVSSPNYPFVVNLVNGLIKLESFPFSGQNEMLIDGQRLTWEIVKVVPLKERPVKGEKIEVRTLSPVNLARKNGKPVLPDDGAALQESLNFVANRKLSSLRGKGLKRKLKVETKSWRKKVVKHTLKSFREKTNKPLMFLTCFEATLSLEGDREDLLFLTSSGLGNRTGQGFGAVEVVG
jgi:CRISPR-associated endoribonuclease Cas6